MGKYAEIQQRVRKVRGVVRTYETASADSLLDVSSSVKDSSMPYCQEIQAEVERHREAVLGILRKQLKADQARLNIVEKILTE